MNRLPHLTAIVVIALAVFFTALSLMSMKRGERKSEYGQFVINKN